MACGAGGNDDRAAPLLEGMGTAHRAITTADTLAQRYFDQGLVLAYAFNHGEAARSFREAIRLDPTCAMCTWGLSYVLGPNINATMDSGNAAEAYAAARRATELAANGPNAERALAEAMAARYREDAPADRGGLDSAYADAMERVVGRFPRDVDARALYAEAIMLLMPWDYWGPDGSARPGTERLIAELDTALAVDSLHPGANHFLIHAVEKQRPRLGLAAAERLRTLVPGAGHLVHMPSHIDLRVGRYHDGSLANERAMHADSEYVRQTAAQGLYPLAYVPHNFHFLAATATLEGRGTRALEAARALAAAHDSAAMREPGLGTLQHYWSTPLYVMVRFGRWDEILREPKPPADLTYPTAVWHYARGIALLRTGLTDAARRDLASLSRIAADTTLASVTIWDINTTLDLLAIAHGVLAGEVAAADGDFDAALSDLRRARAAEDGLSYDEPPPWHLPVRHILGAVLLDAARPAEAEAVYREDLAVFPENGWSLFGLRQALDAQGKRAAAAEVGRRFDAAWRHADVALTASRF